MLRERASAPPPRSVPNLHTSISFQRFFSPLVQKGVSCVREVSAGRHKQKPAAAENSLLQIIRFTGSPQPLETPHLTQAANTEQEQASLQRTATNKSRSVAGKCEGMLHSFMHLQPHLGHIAMNYCFCLTCRLPLRLPGCETISLGWGEDSLQEVLPPSSRSRGERTCKTFPAQGKCIRKTV